MNLMILKVMHRQIQNLKPKSRKKKARLSAGRSYSRTDSDGESEISRSNSSKSQARSSSVKTKDKFDDKSEQRGKEITSRAWTGERPAIFVGTELRVTGVKFCNPETGLIYTLSNHQ
jgi:hypothetical protein